MENKTEAKSTIFTPDKREDLLTNNVGIEKIPELYRSEDFPMEIAQKRLAADTKPSYAYDEVFGTYCNVNEYINVPVDIAYQYAANMYSLEEWTFSVRDIRPQENGTYAATEALAPNTDIYLALECDPVTRVVDYFCAWDQDHELWMRYYCRFIDAQPAMNKPGTIMMWLNCRHPFYNRDTEKMPDFIKEAQARQDRPWVGDIWGFFKAGHELEAKNFKNILETRFNKPKI